MKPKSIFTIHTLSQEQRDLLHDISYKNIKHNFHANLSRILEHGRYTDSDKNLILNPLRKKYIEHLKQIKS